MTPLLQHPLVSSLLELFDHLPEVYFFVKNSDGKFLYANRSLIERLGLPDQKSIIGTTDSDRYPEEVANALQESDRQVLTTGQAIVDKLEVLYNEVGNLEWFSTTKYPIIDDQKKVLGLAGFTRSFSSRRYAHLPQLAASKVIDFVSRNPDRLLTIEELAKRFSISTRQLHRQFREILKITPQEFVLRTRVHASAVVLRSTDESIASVADQFGFCDQSAFTKRFQKVIGTTPAKYRKRAGN